MTSKPTSREPQANPKLTSRWNEGFDLPDSFWKSAEEAAVQEALARTGRRVSLYPWGFAAAACLAGATLLGTWMSAPDTQECVTFACLWESQAELPLTEDELDMLDRWESGYDDLLFDSTSF
jgi:hypothetical protein